MRQSVFPLLFCDDWACTGERIATSLALLAMTGAFNRSKDTERCRRSGVHSATAQSAALSAEEYPMAKRLPLSQARIACRGVPTA